MREYILSTCINRIASMSMCTFAPTVLADMAAHSRRRFSVVCSMGSVRQSCFRYGLDSSCSWYTTSSSASCDATDELSRAHAATAARAGAAHTRLTNVFHRTDLKPTPAHSSKTVSRPPGHTLRFIRPCVTLRGEGRRTTWPLQLCSQNYPMHSKIKHSI